MNIIFAGTPDFAKTILEALLKTTHVISAVYTQPDRPAGRGRHLTASPVKQLALEHDLPVYQPVSLKDPSEIQRIENLHVDVMVVAAYGLLLPRTVLTLPRYGCINVHASLLPQWRGAAPIQSALLAGDKETGITIMQMEEGLDTGPMLRQTPCSIEPTDTAQDLRDRLAVMGATTLCDVLAALEKGDAIKAQGQDSFLATYATKIKKEEARLDWTLSAVQLERMVRAFNPWPVVYSECQGQTVRVWQACVLEDKTSEALPGTIISTSKEGIDVVTGEGILRLLQIQFPGKKIVSAAACVHSKTNVLLPGMRF